MVVEVNLRILNLPAESEFPVKASDLENTDNSNKMSCLCVPALIVTGYNGNRITLNWE